MKFEGPGERGVHHPSHNVKFITCTGKERILIYNLTEALWEKDFFFMCVFALVESLRLGFGEKHKLFIISQMSTCFTNCSCWRILAVIS